MFESLYLECLMRMERGMGVMARKGVYMYLKLGVAKQ